MYKIGEFSTLSKTTIKTLRYYEKEKLLIPSYVDKDTGYRYYQGNQLIELSKIIALRQIGMSIDNIKKYLKDNNCESLLLNRKEEIETQLLEAEDQLSRINYLMEGKFMKYEGIVKELPKCTVYYQEGIIKDFSKITEFVLSAGDECQKLNPNIKCLLPGYCFIEYLDGEYKDHDIKIRYNEAVNQSGVENEHIKFKELEPVQGVCVYHKGNYNKIGEAYSYIMKWIEENHYEVIGSFRECYIDGIWNKDNVEDYLTEIQVPVRKK